MCHTTEWQRVGMPGACVPYTSQKGKEKGSREGPDSCHPPTILLGAVEEQPVSAAT